MKRSTPMLAGLLALCLAVPAGVAATAADTATPPDAKAPANSPATAPAPVFTRDAIPATMRKVNDDRLRQEQGRKSDANPKAQGDSWKGGTYYTGVMAPYRATKDKAVLDQAVAWAERGKWAPGTEVERINNLTCCQTYLELYAIQKDETRIAKTREYVDKLVAGAASRKTINWGYVDALYVGAPAIAMLGEISGDKKDYEYLDKAYWGTTDATLDKEEGLFYRDDRSVGLKTEQGKKVLWGRGNGWGYSHTGWDPEGRFWFWEVKGPPHRLVCLKRYDETGKGQHEFADLTGEWGCRAHGQRSHFHPLLTPDRKWVLFAADEVDAGPKPAGTQLFLLDVSDLTGTDLIADAVRKNPKLIVSETQKRK